MTKIEEAVAKLPFEKDPYFPYQYPEEEIAACEGLFGQPFPEDLRWYLTNVGWRKIDYDHRSILVKNGEYIYELMFEAAEHETFCRSGYTNYLERNEGGRLPHGPTLYFPIGKIEGEFNPSVSLRLLVNLNGQDYGSIWGVRPIGYFGDQTPSEPIRLADDLVSFLELIGPSRKLQPIAAKNNAALFDRLFSQYIAAPPIEPTAMDNPAALLNFFFANRETTIFDGARNIEKQRHTRSARYETAEGMAEAGRSMAENLPTNPFHGSTPVRRRDVKIGTPVKYDGIYGADRLTPHYMVVSVDSVVGENLKLKEEYLLFHDQASANWSIVHRLNSTIPGVKVAGVGVFAFDSTYKWQLKKKVAPAWSELKAELRVEGEEDALTAQRIGFIKEIIKKADFRFTFEAYVFKLYQERFYPEFEAMAEHEQKDWAKAFPVVLDPSEIWQLLGKKASIHVESDAIFEFHVEAGFDPEHGVSVRVQDWQIK